MGNNNDNNNISDQELKKQREELLLKKESDSMKTPKKNSRKPRKKKGILRLEAILPIAIIIILFGVYFKLFFDSNLKSAMEWGASYIYGAEINISNVKTSFINPTLLIKGIQVTDKKEPTRNLFSIGTIRFGLLGDALLRAKVVVEDASILDVQAYSPRKKPGYVKPPPPPNKKESSIMDDIESRALDRLKKQNEENLLGDLSSIAEGTKAKDQLKNIQAELKSEARIKELEKFFKDKEVEWKERIDKLPNKEEVDALVKEAKGLKFNTKNPVQFAADLKAADRIYKELEGRVKETKKLSQDLKTDMGSANQGIKDIDNFIKQDIDDLKKKFKIPSFDTKSFTQALFVSLLNDKLKGSEKYVALAREYMPATQNKTKGEKKSQELIPRPRGEGRTIGFPIMKSYPLFWLKKAAISSQATTSEFSGNIMGSLTNVTTSPRHIGKPAILDIKGDFPNQGISGFMANLKVDHTTDIPQEAFDIKVLQYPFGKMNMANSDKLKFNMLSAMASSSIGGVFKDSKINIAIQQVFKNPQFEVGAQQKFLRDIFQRVVAELPDVVINASFEGSFKSFSTHLNSNLGQALADGFKRELTAEFDAKKKEIEDFVNNKIKAPKEKLLAQFNKVSGQTESLLKGREKIIEDEVSQAKAEVTKQKGSSSPLKDIKVNEKALDNLKDSLKKKLKF